jgi:hypothetical protein
MDWLLVVLLAVQSPNGLQTVERREAVRSELACHTAIMRHMDTKGQQVVEAECLRGGSARVMRSDARATGSRFAALATTERR